MMNVRTTLGLLLLAGLGRCFLLNGEYTQIWGKHPKISPHLQHLTFSQCLQNCVKPFLPNYNDDHTRGIMQKCVKNCMKYQYLCKNFNKCEIMHAY